MDLLGGDAEARANDLAAGAVAVASTDVQLVFGHGAHTTSVMRRRDDADRLGSTARALAGYARRVFLCIIFRVCNVSPSP